MVDDHVLPEDVRCAMTRSPLIPTAYEYISRDLTISHVDEMEALTRTNARIL